MTVTQDQLNKASANLFEVLKQVAPTLKPQDIQLSSVLPAPDVEARNSWRLQAAAVDEGLLNSAQKLWRHTNHYTPTVQIDLSAATCLHPHLEEIAAGLRTHMGVVVSYNPSEHSLHFHASIEKLSEMERWRKSDLAKDFSALDSSVKR